MHSETADWADDLISETMLKAMPHLAVLANLNLNQRKSWLYRVLKNAFLDQLRSRKREKRLAEQFAQVEIENVST